MLSLVFAYMRWHYSVGIRDYLHVWGNFVWFVYHFFSLPLLLTTLFAPWRRLDMEYGSVFELEQFMGNVVGNLVTRIAGAAVKLIFLVLGIVALTVVLFGGAAFLGLWIAIPFAYVLLIASGLAFLIL